MNSQPCPQGWNDPDGFGLPGVILTLIQMVWTEGRWLGCVEGMGTIPHRMRWRQSGDGIESGQNSTVISVKYKNFKCKHFLGLGTRRETRMTLRWNSPRLSTWKCPVVCLCNYLNKKIVSISLSLIRISHFENFENSGRETAISNHDLGVAPYAAWWLPPRPLLANSGNVWRCGKPCWTASVFCPGPNTQLPS